MTVDTVSAAAGNLLPAGWGARGTAGATIAAGLVFEGIHHDYGGIVSVVDFNLSVAPGEIICLLGHSGCGKTTLMRIAAGVERQSRGRVLINGADVASDTFFMPPEKRNVGLMFQDYALFPHMTILDNVMFGLTKMPKSEARQAALAALARVGLADYGDDYPHALSGGEQQRVALARAMVPRPGILLMDEPFSGLDRRLRDSVRNETLAVIRETKATCIIVTHDPEEAMRMGDRIVLMRQGRLVQAGPGEELYKAPVDLFAARFFSELNQIEGVVTSAGIETPLGILGSNGAENGAKVDVCVRPQGLVLKSISKDGVAGRIQTKNFVGEVDLLSVVVDGLDHPLQARARAGSGWKPGMDVRVSADPQDVLVFGKSDPN